MEIGAKELTSRAKLTIHNRLSLPPDFETFALSCGYFYRLV